ncbi:MAG TPA: host attachment protein [Steroidobacteraceae bacterium]|nr:host attachment protein [Steroidobacteraceae bacterium]
MRIRIVVANQAEAAFYDLESRTGEPKFTTRLTDPLAHLHDRDFKSDRPGRFSDHAAPAGGRRGATAHHGTGGERSPRKHEAALFAGRIAEQLEHARGNAEFDRLVVMAAPPFLGLLRKALSNALRVHVAAEVGKDLVSEPVASVRAHIPPGVFSELTAAQ